MNRIPLATLGLLLVVGCTAKQPSDSSAAVASAPASAPATPMTGGASEMAMMTPDANDSAATKGYKAAMVKAMKDTPQRFTGSADIDFMSHMRVHHQAAIDMANVELTAGEDPAVKDLATKIIAAQKAEIATMNVWLKKKGM